ncbi:hypothetical protein K0M31_000991 [Melipona bicolor]|uniref:Uncharacterized protein n=1 Tax=Melipona bicolor TaxID=60889 RepID=A0AA40GEU3_9HYME|nr:hypothetical protein K0M31_000991 [Melipona bicolor]
MAVEIHGTSFSLNATVYNSRSHRDAFAKLESSTNRGEKKSLRAVGIDVVATMKNKVFFGNGRFDDANGFEGTVEPQSSQLSGSSLDRLNMIVQSINGPTRGTTDTLRYSSQQ